MNHSDSFWIVLLCILFVQKDNHLSVCSAEVGARHASPLLMADEKVQFGLNKQQAYIDENKIFPYGGVLNDTVRRISGE